MLVALWMYLVLAFLCFGMIVFILVLPIRKEVNEEVIGGIVSCIIILFILILGLVCVYNVDRVADKMEAAKQKKE